MNSQVYQHNGLVFWTAEHIELRDSFVRVFAARLESLFRGINPAFTFLRVEAPLLTPSLLVNPNYTAADVFVTADELTLRPETTPGSYAYAAHLMRSQAARPPFCVWQHGKSFRREQDQPTKHMRLKEFYQAEFQLLFAEDTKHDYMAACLEPIRAAFETFTGKDSRVVESDRLPSYSRKTMDVEVRNPDKWMEVCSISLRDDFPEPYRFTTGKGLQERKVLNLEVAVGTDRAVYNQLQPRPDGVSE